MDVSGNFKEGMGTTGYAVMENGELDHVGQISANGFDSAESYWQEHVWLLSFEKPDHFVFEGYRLYNHRGQAASSQANSILETPQLIGALRLASYGLKIPFTIQYASQVKTRWSDSVLQHLGVLDTSNRFKGYATNTHKRDAIRHALHYNKYGGK